ncbi:hypothetical protein BDY19DRAFT_769996 [Irpex rosettiformis]|uniref:Uncharacterized protein n=1 Tax=Irpex rosettiformis TaxID=378272 RepID=A0ACB8U7U9_9APHY|nr:hypothetical protein BDY19DRAFT_769996 [Irpex rosettiformis]
MNLIHITGEERGIGWLFQGVSQAEPKGTPASAWLIPSLCAVACSSWPMPRLDTAGARIIHLDSFLNIHWQNHAQSRYQPTVLFRLKQWPLSLCRGHKGPMFCIPWAMNPVLVFPRVHRMCRPCIMLRNSTSSIVDLVPLVYGRPFNSHTHILKAGSDYRLLASMALRAQQQSRCSPHILSPPDSSLRSHEVLVRGKLGR